MQVFCLQSAVLISYQVSNTQQYTRKCIFFVLRRENVVDTLSQWIARIESEFQLEFASLVFQ